MNFLIIRNIRARARALLAVAGLAVVLLPAQSSKQPPVAAESTVPPPELYAGQEVCAECHSEHARTYARTPHATDSAPARPDNILGSFDPEHAVLRTKNPQLAFVMIKSAEGFYQAAVNTSDPQHMSAERKKFDIVVGSGRHGQTYLYWDEDKLFELPVSYWTYTNAWVNSPGYPDGELHWDRKVGGRCLECHASYFISTPPPSNRYLKGSLMLGIDCERCHGPGALHVERERSAKPPRSGTAEVAIVNPAHLSRDRQIDLCALCHGGLGKASAPALTYKAGDDLSRSLKITPPPQDAPVDVHGNQVGSLQQSKCYASGKMTCSTCHNVHQTQEDPNAFSKNCLGCHKVSACGLFRKQGAAIQGRCVECHMPEGKSSAIKTVLVGQEMQATMRNHRIAVYKDAGAPAVEKHP